MRYEREKDEVKSDSNVERKLTRSHIIEHEGQCSGWECPGFVAAHDISDDMILCGRVKDVWKVWLSGNVKGEYPEKRVMIVIINNLIEC